MLIKSTKIFFLVGKKQRQRTLLLGWLKRTTEVLVLVLSI